MCKNIEILKLGSDRLQNHNICYLYIFSDTEQGSANHSFWAKYNPPPFFVNKVLLEDSQVHLCIYYL